MVQVDNVLPVNPQKLPGFQHILHVFQGFGNDVLLLVKQYQLCELLLASAKTLALAEFDAA